MGNRVDITALLPEGDGIRERRRAVEAELGRRPRGRAQLVKILVGILALIAIGTGVAWAAGAFSAKEISFDGGVGCYNEARLKGERLSVTIFQAAADPVAKCGKYWREGVIDTGLRRLGREGKIDYPKGPYPPHLVACAKQGSGISVFPGAEGVCERLGLEPLPDDYAPAGREAARAYTAWDHLLTGPRGIQIKGGRCVAPGPIAIRARRILAAHGYADVRVEISSKDPCAESVASRGRVIEVFTTTPQRDDLRQLEEKVADAVGPLFERAGFKCIGPDDFAMLAREALDRGGLDQVGVHVSQRRYPCTYSGLGFNPSPLQVEVGASPYKVWRFNRRGAIRYRRTLRRRGLAHASN